MCTIGLTIGHHSTMVGEDVWRRVFHSLEPQFCQIGLMIGHNGIMGVGGDVCGTTVLSNRVKDWSPQHTLVGERM